MKKIVTGIIMLFVVAAPSLASTTNNDHPYQQTQLVIKNHAAYPVQLTIDHVDGNWKTPVALKEPILLTKNQTYQNTVMSIKREGDIENFVSLDIAQVDNAHENYLIFAENTSSNSQRVSADIFDGLGPLFVKTKTNYCNGYTQEGYVYCELIIE